MIFIWLLSSHKTLLYVCRELRKARKGDKRFMVLQFKMRTLVVEKHRTVPASYYLRRCFLLMLENQVAYRLTRSDFAKR